MMQRVEALAERLKEIDRVGDIGTARAEDVRRLHHDVLEVMHDVLVPLEMRLEHLERLLTVAPAPPSKGPMPTKQ